MASELSDSRTKPANKISPTLRLWGLRSWYFLGIVLAVLAFVTFFTFIAGLSIPFIVAVVVAMIFYPLVDLMEQHGINRTIGSILVLLLVMLVIAFTIWLMWWGVYSNSETILTQIGAGLAVVVNFVVRVVPPETAQLLLQKVLTWAPEALTGLTSFLFSGFSSLIAFIMGVYTAFFLLYFLLEEWHSIADWVGGKLGVPKDMGTSMVYDSANAMRIYFWAVTIANVPVALAVGITMVLLGLPLAIPVAVVTLLTCYIPYIGALVSAAFAGLVALGAGGVGEATIVLVVILFFQNIAGPVVGNYVASGQLKLNPLVGLLSTMAGGIMFGALGAMLAIPVTAVLIGVHKRLKHHREQNQADDKVDASLAQGVP
jgi:predicted PurR-regulated permease PerM